MERWAKTPLVIVAAMIALVVVASGNLSMLGIGEGSLLYDPMALPRLVPAVVLTCAAWAMWAFISRERRVRLRVDAVWGVLAALAVWASVSAATSSHSALAVLGQSERLEGVVTVVLYALVYGVVLQVVRNVSDARRLAAVLAMSAVLMSVYGLLQFAGLDPANYAHEGFGFDMRRAFATFGNPNFLAGLLVLALPVAVSLGIDAATRRLRLLWSAAALSIGGALFVTFTRGAWLAALIELGAALVIWRPWRTSERRRPDWRIVVALALVSVLLIGVSLNSTGELNVAERLSTVFSEADSTSERLLVAGVVADAVSGRPVTGYGPDTFLPTFRLYRTDEYAEVFGETGTINNAHSWPLQYLATLGIPGALLLVIALLLALVRGLRVVSDEGPPRRTHVLMAGIWIGCLGLAVHLLFNVAVLGASVPLVAMLATLGAPRARTLEIPVGGVRAAGAVFAVMTVVAVAVSVVAVRADALYLRSRQAFYGEREGDAVDLAHKASTLNPLSVKYARGLAEEEAADVMVAIMAGGSSQDIVTLYDVALADFERVMEVDSDDYAAFAWLAALQARVGTYLQDETLLGEAVLTAQKAALLDRQHAQVRDLANGDTSALASRSAASVLPLP